jgi:L-alanine-DL-glutamate epimerase-like enolase superfamily enzyme
MLRITRTDCNFETEPFLAPFGFKGSYLTELWQTVALMESESGRTGIGLGTQSVLWSDAGVFSSSPESAGNSMIYLLTSAALNMSKDVSFETPIDLLDQLLPQVYDYGVRITGRPDLRQTFALNALVAVDNAAWLLYSSEKGISNFDTMVPEAYRSSLSYRHKELANIPLMTYGVALEDIKGAVDDGFFLLKIKIGSDPDKDGDPEKMLAWDMNRLSEIHAAVGDCETSYTDDGHIPYYLDANGRYPNKEMLQRFIDHAEKIGALDRIVLLEEPFPENLEVDVSDIPVRLAVDESAHSDVDASRLIDMGYGAIALKPIAKTLSMSLKIAKVAYERNVPCFCADLTVNPILVEWNKNVASRLAPLPGIKIGVLESNGHQNYRNWELLHSYHPCCGASWTRPVRGIFSLDDTFYAAGGGIYEPSEHYTGLVHT